MPAVNNRFLLLYASQTGQAQAIAEEIAERAEKQNLCADLHCIGETEKRFFIEREKCVVLVASTTGDGDPPDTARKFFRRIHKKTLADDYLTDLKFTVLGLGDSNYSSFCNHPRNVNKRLLSLGANHFYPPGWADDAVGLEIVVDPWIDNLWEALRKCLNLTADSGVISDFETVSPTQNQSSDTDTVEAIINPVNNTTNSTNTQNHTNPPAKLSDSNSATINTSENSESKSLDKSVTDPETLNMAASNKSATVDSSDVGASSEKPTWTGSNSSVKGDQNEVVASVIVSVPPLSESTLTVPLLSPAFLEIQFQSGSSENFTVPQTGVATQLSSKPVTMATLSAAKVLTTENAVKKAIAVILDVTGSDFTFEPGDSFQLVCPNSRDEVLLLLDRLGCKDAATCPYTLGVLEGTKKKNAHVPDHISPTGNLINLFMTCIDIRETPKKALLRVLVEYTTKESEKRRLQELCSKQGTSDYTKYLREPSLCILDILNWFPSCQPPVERLIEHLPKLKPRPYSICSSPLRTPNKLEFVFNVIDIPPECGRTYHRKGVCTGWLDTLVPAGSREAINTNVSEAVNSQIRGENDDYLSVKMDSMSLMDLVKVHIIPQTNQRFHLPDDVTIPLILIGPGTGVAPFLGFLEHRAAQKTSSQMDGTFGDIWLFFGCRHKERDYLYRQELSDHIQSGVLSQLKVCFSRDEQTENAPRYVQHNLELHGQELVDLVQNRGAHIYVCGDARNMAKDVNETFIKIWMKHTDVTAEEARKTFMKLRLEKRYLEDVWT